MSVSKRLTDVGSPAALRGWTDELLPHIVRHWDNDLGGRSTRDYIEETVVEAIAEALDGLPADMSAAAFDLDVEPGAPRGGGGAPSTARVVCRVNRDATLKEVGNPEMNNAVDELPEDELPSWSTPGGAAK